MPADCIFTVHAPNSPLPFLDNRPFLWYTVSNFIRMAMKKRAEFLPSTESRHLLKAGGGGGSGCSFGAGVLKGSVRASVNRRVSAEGFLGACKGRVHTQNTQFEWYRGLNIRSSQSLSLGRVFVRPGKEGSAWQICKPPQCFGMWQPVFMI